MAAPPGFDPTASVLPDPGASSAPIHVMRGGGMKGGDRNSILRAYELGPGQKLDSEFSEQDKEKFVAALNSGGCNWQIGSITNAKCAPVVNVLKALLKQKIKSVNATAIPKEIEKSTIKPRGFPDIFRMGRPTTRPIGFASEFSSSSNHPSSTASTVSSVATESNQPDSPIVIVNEAEAAINSSEQPGRNSGSQGEETDMNNNANYNFPPINNNVEESLRNNLKQNQNIFKQTMVNSPKMNYRGNMSRRTANVRLNLTRKNKRIFSNFNINSKPTRIYGNSPQNIAKRYNYELSKSKKNVQKRAENAERTKRNSQIQKQKFAWEKQAQKETVKSVKSSLNQQIAALRAEKKSLPQTKKWYQVWKGGKKTRRGNRK
jgi:hypothetical protein